jgi:hypothetical protein
VKSTMLFIVATMLGASAFAQNTPQLVPLADAASSPNPYRAIVISRTVQAVNYEHRNQATKVDFAGTTLMPSADGWAKVENKRGNLAITAEFGNLDKPTAFGGEYLTYVMWAISPEGRPVNLGEVLVGGNHRSKLPDNYRSAVLRADYHCRALLRGSPAQQCRRARERRARRYPGHQRSCQREV